MTCWPCEMLSAVCRLATEGHKKHLEAQLYKERSAAVDEMQSQKIFTLRSHSAKLQ